MNHGWGFAGGGFAGGGYGGRGYGSRRFEEQYHCYSVAFAGKPHLEGGDKILLPPSAFESLARLEVEYPMLFRLHSEAEDKTTHCGVLEFTAEEGTCCIPFWMMQNLLIEEGTVITITNVSLPKATFIKVQPNHEEFLEISNPRAVLENALRNYSCVTKGDTIQIQYNNKNYHLDLKEVKPQDAACIIETDCEVDFEAPIGYKEPDYSASASNSVASSLPNETGSSAAAPSPTASTANVEEDEKPQGIRIVNGKIVRPDEEIAPTAEMTMAERTGGTGVQRNAAIPLAAPKVDYWAVNCGDGARLDGKSATPLKDKKGNEVDIRKLRAEAAAKRAEAAAAAATKSGMTGSGMTLTGETVPGVAKPSSSAPVSKRKSRVGTKYSRLKQSNVAFKGAANSMK